MAVERPPNSMRSRMKKRIIFAAAALVLSILSLMFLTTNAGQEMPPLFIGLGIVGLVIAVPLALNARWSRARAKEVDNILDGRDRLAYWTYRVIENGRSRQASVYIGWKGVYFDNEYFHFQAKKRRLVRAYLVEKEPVGTLRLICREEVTRSSEDRRPGNIVRFPTVAIPVPPGMNEVAQNIVDQYVARFDLKTVASGEEPEDG